MGIMKLFLYLRKSKIFNKSRYSRNRQNTRVAFYLSVLINILVIFAVFSLYYKILFKLSILWWFFYIFLFSFVFGGFMRTLPSTSLNSVVKLIKNLFNNKK